MYRLPELSLQDMALCSGRLRRAGEGASCLEQAAARIVRLLYEDLGDTTGSQRACVLVRFYKTHPLGDLQPELQAFARGLSGGGDLSPETRCLTLISTIGDEPSWCSRHESKGHQAIPLPSPEAVERSPMISQLVRQLGIDIAMVVNPDPALIVDSHQHSFNVFHVPEAEGSPFIPAQRNFVVPHGVRSVIGFGGLLPAGDLFAVILFARVPVSRETAEMFRPLALAAKLAVLSLRTFPDSPAMAERDWKLTELEARIAALEQLLEVQERTVVEQGERLDEQARQLKRSNEELERFAYIISHDLQEPLRMVSSYTQLLGDRYRGQLDEKADRFIDYAVGGAKRMQQLINDLLTYSRVTNRGRNFVPSPLDGVVDAVLVDLEVLIRETGAAIRRDPLPVVLADRSQMRQLFQNLIANALHYRQDGIPVEVSVTAEREADHWHLAVRDNGIGIDPRFHERIFAIFQRLDRKRTNGTGIGLALCKRIVEHHGGLIWLDSAPGTGSTFHFTLPAAEEAP
jgi:signal transduction histidine kinase